MLAFARSLSISPAMCGVVPMPAETKLSLPGFAFAYSMSCARLVAGTEGFTTSTKGEEPITDTVCRSFSRS